MGETILYLAPTKQQQPQYLLQMITTTDTMNSGIQHTKPSCLPEFSQPGQRPREERQALRYLLENKYWWLETCSLQNQDDKRN